MQTWLMPFDTFRAACRAVKTGEQPRYANALMRSQEDSISSSYTVYVDRETLEVVNPWTKKFAKSEAERRAKRRNLESFTARDDSWQAKVSAYCWIVNKAREEGLFDPAVCDPQEADRILNQPIL